MQAARRPGFEFGRSADELAPPRAKRGEQRSHTAPAAAANQSDIVRTLAAGSSGGLADVLVYGAPGKPAETHC